jgi:putative transposase
LLARLYISPKNGDPYGQAPYPLKLSDDERTFLFDFTRKGIRPAREIKRALVLLNSTDPTLDNSALAQRFGVSRATVENVQRHYRRGGLERALHEAPRSGQPKKITQREEAYITAIACSKPPAGQARWTMQMIADRLVELRYLDAISDESVRLVLKKTPQTLAEKALVYRHPKR